VNAPVVTVSALDIVVSCALGVMAMFGVVQILRLVWFLVNAVLIFYGWRRP
jgi:hypothetical protein